MIFIAIFHLCLKYGINGRANRKRNESQRCDDMKKLDDLKA